VPHLNRNSEPERRINPSSQPTAPKFASGGQQQQQQRPAEHGLVKNNPNTMVNKPAHKKAEYLTKEKAMMITNELRSNHQTLSSGSGKAPQFSSNPSGNFQLKEPSLLGKPQTTAHDHAKQAPRPNQANPSKNQSMQPSSSANRPAHMSSNPNMNRPQQQANQIARSTTNPQMSANSGMKPSPNQAPRPSPNPAMHSAQGSKPQPRPAVQPPMQPNKQPNGSGASNQPFFLNKNPMNSQARPGNMNANTSPNNPNRNQLSYAQGHAQQQQHHHHMMGNNNSGRPAPHPNAANSMVHASFNSNNSGSHGHHPTHPHHNQSIQNRSLIFFVAIKKKKKNSQIF
jgi:hypothetical protein